MTEEQSQAPNPGLSAPSLSAPYQLMGNSEELVHRLVRCFYRRMADTEPDLARTHELDPNGYITERSQLRFALFLVEWLGGPTRYTPENGHPRLRMRHARVPITTSMRDAWLRCMSFALDEVGVDGEVRIFLNTRFAEVAEFLRNRPE